MENNTSLNDFIEKQMTLYDIENNKKNFSKIYKKCQRTLINMGIWENAETILIGKNKTKIFDENQINELKEETSNYFLKLSKYDKTKFDKIKEDNWNEFFESISTDYDYLDDLVEIPEIEDINNTYFPPKVQKADIMFIMLASIFKIHFKLDLRTWQEDLEFCNKRYQIKNPEEYVAFISSDEYIIRKNRLSKKANYVTKKRTN